jgi:hypothetical protein
MKVGDKVKTWTNNVPGIITNIYPDGTVDVKYKGSKGVDNIPLSMCEKI